MLESIVTSKTRIQMLLRFFMNPERISYLRELSKELGESSNAIRVELNHLSQAKIIQCVSNGHTKRYQANKEHPLFPELHTIVRKMLGVDKVIVEVIERLGDVRLAFITGDYALGIDSGIIDLILVGEIDKQYLTALIERVEQHISNRKIRCLCLAEREYCLSYQQQGIEAGWLEVYRNI